MDRSFKNWAPPDIKHGKPTKYGWTVFHPANLFLGEDSDIGCGTVILAHEGVGIGVGAQIGPNCSIMSKSTIDNRAGAVVIGARACIGANSVVMPGVTIGRRAVVGACSFVNRDIPDGETWCGAPARKKGGE